MEDESSYMIDSGEISRPLTEEEIERLGLFER
jgi:hypothetical protein